MPPLGPLDIAIALGASWKNRFVYCDNNQKPYTFNLSTLKLWLKKNAEDTTPLLDLFPATGTQYADVTRDAGQVQMKLPFSMFESLISFTNPIYLPNMTKAYLVAYYDFAVQWPSGLDDRLQNGRLLVIP
jgi:hypothetical protein